MPSIPAFGTTTTIGADELPDEIRSVWSASHWANYEDPGSFNRIAGEFLTTTDLGV